jgi:signal transduction histidine kinase
VKRPPSLTLRLIATLAAVQTLVIAAVVTFIIGSQINRYGAEAWMANLVANAVADSLAVDDQGRAILKESPILKNLLERHPALWFRALTTHGDLARGERPPSIPRPFDKPPGDGQDFSITWAIRENGHIVAVVKSPEGELPVFSSAVIEAGVLEFQNADIPDLIVDTLSNIEGVIPVFGPSLAAALIAIALVVRRQLRVLRRASAAAAALNPDRRGARLPEDNIPREVLALIRSVNAMLERLDEWSERQRRFIADAAHELRTPIAILRTRLDALPDDPLKDTLLRDARRLSDLSTKLLDLERLRVSEASLAPLDLVALTREAVADVAPLATEEGYEISFSSETERLDILGDATALRRAVGNLIDNAIRHGGGRGGIRVAVFADGGLIVEDDGPGVPPQHAPYIFDPFFRGTKTGQGTGLGLHLVREIIRAHPGAAISLDSRAPESGARFRLHFLVLPSQS